ncbi:unnamed protein product [Bursaphelenchus okinawaensis]|uniref:Peptidase A1 domain-containing protein n=1 Tax=Bursaphelenchus okinawaensis TaxID=465554 RepID=A0A811K5M2_9BILA|nr:unnamed protein product [Bursaphelenchus okinawaensis]CAG9091824.1 unnamed protein product [Bursaphelenchus okinawaensis]
MLRCQILIFIITTVNVITALDIELVPVKPRHRLKRGTNSTVTVGLENNYNVRYVGKIGVGTPPQTVQLVFDTGSSVFWVPEHNCKSTGKPQIACRYKSKTYDPKNSTTSKLLYVHGLNVSYSLGKAYGDMRQDTLWIGSSYNTHKVPNFKFGSMYKIHDLDFGMLGLAPKRPTTSYSYFFNELKKTLPRPLFSIHLKSCPTGYCTSGGNVKFGSLDYSNCENTVIWTKNLNPKHWTFKVDSMWVGDTVLNTDFTAITDSGHSYTQLDHSTFLKFLKAAKITKNRNPTTYTIPCDQLFYLTLTVNGRSVDIPSYAFVGRQYGNNCELTIMEGPKVIMGQAFLRAVCNHHDYDNNKIGFSNVKTVRYDEYM